MRLKRRNGPTMHASSIDPGHTLADLVRRSPVSCLPDTPIRDALGTMRREDIGAMIVAGPDGVPAGILTLKDVLGRVAQPGNRWDAPIASVMSGDLVTLPAQASVYDAALAMMVRGIHHVVVVEEGRLAGVVSDRDVSCRLGADLRQASRMMREARSEEQLRAFGAAVHDIAHGMLAQDAGPAQVTLLVTTMNDALTRQLVAREMAAEALGPIEICWIAMGSEGRFEQTLVTDQDNGIVFQCAELPADEVRAGLLPAARRVNEALAAAGFSLCRGGIMASNPQCCLSLAEWRDRFADWIDVGDPKALLNATIFFDFRPIVGVGRLAVELREWLGRYAAGNDRFLVQMTQNALENQPPLGLFRDFILTGGGEHPHTLDLKVNGITPFVDAARIYALEAGVAQTGTLERFRAAGAALELDAATIEGWTEAFLFIQSLRLRHHHALGRQASPIHNHIDPRSLSEIERRILLESMRQARGLQSRLASDHSLGPAGVGA
jgi:CBS domain-containing protein